jgi:hypothetical protein
LDGILQVCVLNGFRPEGGNSFQIINATGGVTGTFANIVDTAALDQMRATAVNGSDAKTVVNALNGLSTADLKTALEIISPSHLFKLDA